MSALKLAALNPVSPSVGPISRELTLVNVILRDTNPELNKPINRLYNSIVYFL